MGPTDEPRLNPTDKQILSALSDGNRQTPKNLAAIIEADASYVSARKELLIEEGYAMDPGVIDSSGMIEITRLGLVAVAHLECYSHTHATVFYDLCERVLETESASECEFDEDALSLTDVEERIVGLMDGMDGVAIPSDVASRIDGDVDVDVVADSLFALYFYGITERHDGIDAYTLSPTYVGGDGSTSCD